MPHMRRPATHGGKHRKGLMKAVNKGTKITKHLTTKKQRKMVGNAGAAAIAGNLAGMGRTAIIVPGSKLKTGRRKLKAGIKAARRA